MYSRTQFWGKQKRARGETKERKKERKEGRGRGEKGRELCVMTWNKNREVVKSYYVICRQSKDTSARE